MVGSAVKPRENRSALWTHELTLIRLQCERESIRQWHIWLAWYFHFPAERIEPPDAPRFAHGAEMDADRSQVLLPESHL